MLSLSTYKTAFIAIVFIGVFICCIPSVMLFVHSSGVETFSELYALGPGHMAYDYPYDVQANVHYSVYLGVGNHMGKSVYYEVRVKFRNSTEPLPNATTSESSSLPVLYKYRVFLSDGDVWEAPLNFTLLDVAFEGNVSSVGRLGINGVIIDVAKMVSWDNATGGFYYQVFVELWRHNVTSNSFGFDNRFICLWLNLAQSF
jgi:hypothetical protein